MVDMATPLSRREMLRISLALSGTLCFAQLATATAGAALNESMSGDLAPVHDPCIIKAHGSYHLFCTGQQAELTGLIPWRTSKDLVNWQVRGRVFEAIPEWALAAVPGARGLWAPDIAWFNNRYHLYYSCSTFGSNRSVIGLAVNATLDPGSSEFRWRDQGLVVASQPGDDFNAIDANHFIDREGRHWLALGSFWSGLKLFPLDPATGKLMQGDTRKYSLAARPAPQGGPGAIEAPYMIERDGYYYLFASFDYCCKGVNSTYYVAVGRSRQVTGPYVGRDGRSMADGYGTVVLEGDRRFRGPGHQAVLRDAGKDYLVYHAYDAEHEGRATLRISPISWTADGWPTAQL
jgi:arabinan endo-1,5-alpha-L-arabinosidase